MPRNDGPTPVAEAARRPSFNLIFLYKSISTHIFKAGDVFCTVFTGTVEMEVTPLEQCAAWLANGHGYEQALRSTEVRLTSLLEASRSHEPTVAHVLHGVASSDAAGEC